ncbi:MAG: hypothetical protein RI562_06490 [Salibacter sp.]|uniref:hypothetical protein n=1 Tax=Salibacter sp. TaxID=2010995 RepID=UPI00286FD39A|nr:hypothetical protein [Salibacter sp.]MDR9398693.1 hypothetical protein [Salibacter sp.]
MKKLLLLAVSCLLFTSIQAQVKSGLTDREKELISNACEHFDMYVNRKGTATGFAIGGFVVTGVGAALATSSPTAAYTTMGIGGTLMLIGWFVDRSAAKHIGNASTELRMITGPINLNLPDSIE